MIDTFYNRDVYTDDIEDIEKYINEYNTDEYYKILENDKRTSVKLIFSEHRYNIIKWCNLDKNATVLEIGANYGEITQHLSNDVKSVTAVELSQEKVNCIEKRLIEHKNVDVVLCEDLKRLQKKEKYDYVTLVGILEYASVIGFKDIEEMIKWALQFVKDNGKLIIALDNKFGAKYLSGAKKEKNECYYRNYGIGKEIGYKLYSKKNIEEILEKVENIKYKFYYPVPDYKLVHNIYTDSYTPRNARYDIYYLDNDKLIMNELFFLQSAIENHEFRNFTNSFLVEICKNNGNLFDTRFISYTNMRNENYKIYTKINELYAEKVGYSQKSVEHIKQIDHNNEILRKFGYNVIESLANNTIKSKFTKLPTLEEFLMQLIKKNQIELFYKEIDKWYVNLNKNLQSEKYREEIPDIFKKYSIDMDDNKKACLHYVKYGFIDLVFQNTFFDNGKYLVFDQEWLEQWVPVEFILYRSLKKMFFQRKDLQELVDLKKLYEKYNIEDYIDFFENLEEKWQEKIVKKMEYKFYESKWDKITSLEDIEFQKNQEVGRLYNKNENLEREYNQLKAQYEEIYNSYEKLQYDYEENMTEKNIIKAELEEFKQR